MPHTLDILDRALVWFRRDLRLNDHTALRHALQRARQVWCAFVFDSDILNDLPRADRRVDFIHASLVELDQALRAQGGGLIVVHGSARTALPRLAEQLGVQAVFMNRDDEPDALRRDAHVRGDLANHGIALYSDKDHVVFERDEVLSLSGTPYNVFTPYKNAWLKRYEALHPTQPEPAPFGQLAAPPAALHSIPSLADLGFEPAPIPHLPSGSSGAQQLLSNFLARIDRYDQNRDFPALKGPSYLSVHLRFGTVSVRELVRLSHARAKAGSRGAEVWLSELIWREFYMQVLYHHAHVVERCFQPACDALRWDHGQHAEALFAAWCEGRTGYPLVDAAMRQINQTGYMHNRLRMVTASFLTKDLGIDWRRGEAYFARHLNDFDLAANNGGWQWAASTGCDAQPYFRIFNPVSQSEKFDPEGRFIRRYVPELSALPDAALHAPWRHPVELAAAGIQLGQHYPEPVVDHEQARQKTLARFAKIKPTPPVKSA
ncbi:MAG: deoxyribodipyrimidine photo-lyase [Leptothrix ochracea]|uniref:cryptochrome/photolyase family protein n=1 Tax=Leptothrix ochracea TaxID=735331 RepID=UPI0034E27D7F